MGNLIKELCGDLIRAMYMGGDSVFFQPTGNKEIRLEDLRGFLDWFEFIWPWSEGDVNNRRVIWTR